MAAALSMHAAVASAGTYRVYSCVAPSGGAAPVGDSSYGWQPSPRAQAASLSLVNSCASGQGLTARLAAPGSVPLGAGGQWIFMPPPETSIAGFDLTWSGTAANGGESTISRSDQPDPTYERRYTSTFASERVVENNLGLSHLLVLVACSFANPCPAGPDLATYRMTESTMTLRDNTAPTAANVSGDLVASPEWRGPMSLAFSAADTGSGVYRIIVSVDGQDALGVVVDANDGRCADADATNADAHEFLWPVPCKASAAPQLAVDTGGLPLGAHAVSLLLEDAAGNRTPIYGPVAKTILAPPAGRGEGNGTPASDAARFTGRRNRSVTTSFAHRRLRVGAGSSVPTASRSPARGSTCSPSCTAPARAFATSGTRAPTGAAGSATRHRRARRGRCASATAPISATLPSPPRSTCCSACAPAPPSGRASGSSRAAAG